MKLLALLVFATLLSGCKIVAVREEDPFLACVERHWDCSGILDCGEVTTRYESHLASRVTITSPEPCEHLLEKVGRAATSRLK